MTVISFKGKAATLHGKLNIIQIVEANPSNMSSDIYVIFI
jgi:hypothetical protein